MFNFKNQGSELKAVLYGRVSSEDQAERGTIQNQIEFSTKYCDLHKINIDEQYLDDGVTGTLPLEERGDGLRLIEDAKAGKFSLVLIYRLDRLGRTARVILNAIHELEGHGVQVRSMTEPFDTGDPSGRFLVTILAGVADLDRSSTLDRLWNGANRAAREGKWLGGIVPFGYLKEDAYLIPSIEPMRGFYMSEVEVVSMVYRLTVEEHMSTKKIADYLNSLGVPPSYTKDGRQIDKGKRKENTAGIWRPGRVRGMIVNTTYKGIHEYGRRSKKQREIISREFPSIVDVDVWERAQEVLHENQIGAMRNAKRKYLLRSLVKCGSCGLSYCGTSYTGPSGLPKGYYVCNGKLAYHGPDMGKCNSKNIPQAWVEELVWSDIIRFVNDPDEVLQTLKQDVVKSKSNLDQFSDEKEIIGKALKQKETEKHSILDLFRKNLINSVDVEQQLKKIADEAMQLANRFTELSQNIQTEEVMEDKFMGITELLNQLRLRIHDDIPWEEKRDIVKMLVRRVVVNTKNDGTSPSATVSIEYTFSQVVIHTDKRAVYNLGMVYIKKEALPAWRLSKSSISETSPII